MSRERASNQDVLEQLPRSLQQLLVFERFHLHKPELFQNRSRDPDFDPGYFPQNSGVVQLPCYWIERRHLQVVGSQANDGVELGIDPSEGGQGCVLFPIHPSGVAHYEESLLKLGARKAAKEGLRIWAVATSSTRTLLAWPDQRPERALFLKTSLHSDIFGDRRLPVWKVARSIGLSSLVQRSRHELPAGLSFLAESLGGVVRAMPDLGVIVRSIPEPIRSNQLTLAPLFALFGGQGVRPLFLTLMEQARLAPLEFIEQVLCAKFARVWLDLSLKQGLILEAHAQDLMLCLQPDLGRIEGFCYRDFEGLQVDWELRSRRGLLLPADLPNSRAWYETYATWGYRYGQLVWYKLRISLLQYLHFVLKELEERLRVWWKSGLLWGARIDEDALTAMFSRTVVDLIHELFGVRVTADYNIHHNLSRFVRVLLNIRKEMLGCRENTFIAGNG